ncbi:uncharacterized protein [Euwallacea fornicatus]|uniref:uncharacterized protein isoform X1 n=2 Tax=Euwallacea fornicatus TaxID=995702 RepID=UPI00338D4C85
MNFRDDILEELSTADIADLAKIYEKHETELPHLHSFLQMCLKSRNMGMTDYVHVYSPKSCWKEDGTFLASVPNHGHEIILHSLDNTGKKLMKGLEETQRFKFLTNPARIYTYFYAVHQDFFPKVYDFVANVRQYEIYSANKPNMWCLRKEKALMLNTTCPEGVYVKELESEDIGTIVDNWELSFAEAGQKLENWLKLRKGFGVYLAKDDKLLSWISPSCFGQMAALQTLDEHKRKGYGSLVVKHMAKYLAEEGFDCCGTVNPENKASEAVLKKLGFEVLFQCQYIAVYNKY